MSNPAQKNANLQPDRVATRPGKTSGSIRAHSELFLCRSAYPMEAGATAAANFTVRLGGMHGRLGRMR
jgi:hypothetical protein